MPILEDAPDKSFSIIGTLSLHDTFDLDGWQFQIVNERYLLRIIGDKARQLGADAVVMAKRDWHINEISTYFPGSWSSRSDSELLPIAEKLSRACPEQVHQSIPSQYIPEHTRVERKLCYAFEAQMIVYK